MVLLIHFIFLIFSTKISFFLSFQSSGNEFNLVFAVGIQKSSIAFCTSLERISVMPGNDFRAEFREIFYFQGKKLEFGEKLTW